MDATTAHQWGLVNRLVEPDRLIDEAMALATKLASGPSVTIEMTKQLVNDLTREGLDRQLQNEAWAGTRVGLSEDQGEGRRAFIEGRPPQWTGR